MEHDFKYIHERTGCYGCYYADKAALGKGPCCTFAFKLDIDKDGKCHTRKPEKHAVKGKGS